MSLQEIHQRVAASVLIAILIIAQNEIVAKEYGDACSNDRECISVDPKNPLQCFDPIEPTTTTPEVTSPITDETPTMTTEETIPSETTTDEPTTSSENLDTTTDESTTTSENLDTTTDEPTTTSENSDTTTDEPAADILEEDFEENFFDEMLLEPIRFNNFDDEQRTLISSVCHCLPDMIRDIALQRCVSPALGVCDLRSGDGNAMRTCTQFSQCFPTSQNSSREGACRCNINAVEDPISGTCKLKYGSTGCNVHEDCDAKNFLTCDNGTCACLYNNLMKWNPKEEKCGFISGESCAEKNPYPKPPCIENAHCGNETQICTCNIDEGYLETPEKECKRSYNMTCNANTECHPNFVCSANICTCPEEELYNTFTARCHIPVGSSCDSSNDRICVSRAKCAYQKCECESGYIESSEHTCHAQFDSKCSENVPCHIDEYLSPCNTTSFPFCQCKQNYRPHPQTKKCVGNLDEECRVDADCIDHSVCGTNKCTCGGNYIPGDSNTECFASFGESCLTSNCYPAHFLRCNENKACNCENGVDQTYDAIKGSCVALAGKLCLGSGKGIGCVQNSECTSEGSQTRCVCMAGFYADNSGFCSPNQVESSAMMLAIQQKMYVYSMYILLSAYVLPLLV